MNSINEPIRLLNYRLINIITPPDKLIIPTTKFHITVFTFLTSKQYKFLSSYMFVTNNSLMYEFCTYFTSKHYKSTCVVMVEG